MMVMIVVIRNKIEKKFCYDGNDDANKNKESRKTRTETKARLMNGEEDILEPITSRQLKGTAMTKNKMEQNKNSKREKRKKIEE